MSTLNTQVAENASTMAQRNAEMLEEMLRHTIITEAPRAVFGVGKKILTGKATEKKLAQEAFNRDLKSGVMTGILAGSMFGSAGLVINAINAAHKQNNNDQF